MSLRVALVQHTLEHPPRPGAQRAVAELAAGLAARGHQPVVLSAHRAAPRRCVEDGVRVLRVLCPPDGLLDRRGFTGPLTHLPFVLAALRRGDFDVAHAFSAPDAAAALRWGRGTARPVVFTCADGLDRARVADRRLRLRLLRDATERSQAVTATTPEDRAALQRWLAVEATLLAPGDAAGHERLYEHLRGGLAAGAGG